MHKLRFAALAGVLALVVTILPPVGQTVVHATPITLSETLTDLPELEVAPRATEPGSVGLATASAARSLSQPIETPLTFNMVGMRAPGSATAVRVRTSEDGVTWTGWDQLDFIDPLDGPDPGTDEDRAAQGSGQPTEPLWIGEASHLQVEVEGASARDVEVTIIDSMGSSGGPVQRTVETSNYASAKAAEGDDPLLDADADAIDADATDADADAIDAEATDTVATDTEATETDATVTATVDLDVPQEFPAIISRAAWGADESLRNDSPSYASEVHAGVVHHTAHTSSSSANTYSRDEAPGIMRAMYRYHTRSLGWSDIGYNIVIDRFGRIYEGRAGGITRGVIGAHARGQNTGSFGVSVIGNFLNAEPSQAALNSLAHVIAWKSAIHGIDTTGWTNGWYSDSIWRPTIVGHRDVGQTACPGQIQRHLPTIREAASGFDLPFPDVLESSPHRGAVLELAAAGVTEGCRDNIFCPDIPLTRDQAASFVVRAFEITPLPGQRFPDVPATNVHAGAINALAEMGWILGKEDGTYAPREYLTRGQLASVLARSFGDPDVDALLEEIPYPDLPADHAHVEGILTLWQQDVRGDCGGGQFCADDEVLRDSTASFVNMVRQVHLAADGTLDSLDLGVDDGSSLAD